MKDILSFYTKNLLSLLLFLQMTGGIVCYGQEQISGVVNKYGKVTSIGAGYVIISDLIQAGQFNPGDYVLLIQMQGVGIQTAQGSYGVNVQAVFGTPGGYEFLIIQSVNYLTGRVDFTRNIYINSYNINGNVQLVQVPFYNSPVVTGTLSCQSWNSITGTGGILALFAGRKLTLNSDIDLTGNGFVGAAGVAGIGECVYTNESANNHDSYPVSWNNAGLKGEGVAIHDAAGVLLYPNHAKGQGRNFTGGGGGNGWFSGGGGGSNRGKGADGGREKFVLGLCGNDPRDGGYGGLNIIGTVIQNGLFPGGGGGASTQASGSTASDGGNGGGIIIIVADTINGNGHYINSRGTAAANASGDAGAGGGGAGGSVAVSFQTLSGQILISANGGNGGTNPADFGGGGGGGGGLIWLSSASVPPAVTSATIDCGIPEPSTPAEGIGEIKYNYIPALNGFLFNSIVSAATGNRIDSVCSNVMYGQMKGTVPVGGIPPYTFQWQISTTSATSGFAPAPGTNNTRHYNPPALLSQTTWFRRVVTDNGASITDISLPVKVTVHPFIKNNAIGDPDTLCYNQIASAINPVLSLQDGNGIYTYIWEYSTDNSVYNSISATTSNYQPPAPLTQTTWYRRIVHSGACIDVSSTVRINVLDTIKNNSILTLPQEICHGSFFTDLTGTTAPTLTGGDNTYRYRWESSSNGTSWVNAAGMNSLSDYNPQESAPYFPGQQLFRRVVMSGSNNVCINYSQSLLLNDYPVITNNSITSGDQTICSGSLPAQLTGSTPLNGKGAGTYTYTWQDSTKSHLWINISGYTGGPYQNYTPPALTDTTSFRRIVVSSACSSTSASIIIKVHKPVANNEISLPGGGSDTTLCSGSTPHLLTGTIPSGGTNLPGDYSYQWSSSTDNSNWSDIGTFGTGRLYQPGSLGSTTWFRRKVTSGLCSSSSGQIRIVVLPQIGNNYVTGAPIVCKGDSPGQLVQDTKLLNGGSGTYTFFWEDSHDGIDWNPAPGINNSSDGNYLPPDMTSTIMYRRKVKSGPNDCCSSISNAFEITLDSLPDGTTVFAGRDTSLFTFDYIIKMAADQAFDGGTGNWSLVEGTGSIQNESDPGTKISGLSKGLNRFLWRVTKGACKLEDLVDVNVYDLIIPEGFSPNNDPDGYNNTFEVKGLDLPNQEAELTIVNGAGTEIFHTSNRNGAEWQEWDGKNSKGIDLPEGTYYYLLKIKSKGNNMVFKKSGFIVLKRY